MNRARIFALAAFLLTPALFSSVEIGAKNFTEGLIVAEIIAQHLEAGGVSVERSFGMGGTGVALSALQAAEIDLYPEYDGTLINFLHTNQKNLAEKLAQSGVEFGFSLGFENSYALAISQEVFSATGWTKLSQVDPNRLRVGLSHEFLQRPDGFEKVKEVYKWPTSLRVESMEHTLAYRAFESGKVDLIDIYTTDASLAKIAHVILEDDLGVFGNYRAGVAFRSSLDDEARRLLRQLEGTLDEATMQLLNVKVENSKETVAAVAKYFLTGDLTDEEISKKRKGFFETIPWSLIFERLKEHLQLVLIPVLVAFFTGIPLAIIVFERSTLKSFVVATAGFFQTIPSLALLTFLIPVFGIGKLPAFVALFLYALLPIVSGAILGLSNVPTQLIEVSHALGFNRWQTLMIVRLPLSMASLLSGIRTAVLVTTGTATLAALIGAGGLGAPIISGLTINNMALVLAGAVPAALLAIFFNYSFNLLELLLVPALRRKVRPGSDELNTR
ncbi:MAG: ABC transporter permease [Bdellovibrionales bacterium CG10_big_fil_rev_8_21_14_0_10_45_34]|nr:MAG: ABC transporter permease [Bdellovibrionales bacterium CG10_big_fil_rev_8_21_14_0_10_45_34]